MGVTGTSMTLKRIFCDVILLSILLACTAFAKYGGGSGTAQDPYLISTASQMNAIGQNSGDWDKHFLLTADIDLSAYTGTQFNLIGTYHSKPFTGVFDGQGYTISNFTYESTTFAVGIFSYIDTPEAIIKNIGIIDPNIEVPFNTGALAGIINNGTIENSWVTGGTLSAFNTVGGLVGDIFDGTIQNCYTITNVNANQRAGGIAGVNTHGNIINCLSASIVSSSGYKGAVVGEGSTGTYAGCFYDIEMNPAIYGIGDIVGDPCGVTGGNTSTLNNLHTSQTYIEAGWDIVTPTNIPYRYTWRMCADDVSYPVLSCQYLKGDFLCPDGVDVIDLTAFANEWMLEIFDIEVDFYLDRHIDFKDWAVLAAAWQSEDTEDRFNPSVDIITDGKIDEFDIALFAQYWLTNGAYHLNADTAPYGGDDIVNMLDYAAFANQWYKSN